MVWLPISEFTSVDLASGHTFLVFSQQWFDHWGETMPHGVTVGYASESAPGVFTWAIAAIDGEGEFSHFECNEPAPFFTPTHFARVTTPVPLPPLV